MPYGASFAAVYDALMAEDFDYTAWAAYYTDLLASAGVHPGYLVECGCGTASLGIEWARRGIRVLGVDQSPDMLAIAAQRARQADPDAEQLCHPVCRTHKKRCIFEKEDIQDNGIKKISQDY